MPTIASTMMGASGSKMLFECADGSIHTIDSESLSIVINGGILTADNGKENIELPAADVKRFFFGDESGIDNPEAPLQNVGKIDVFTTAGVHLGQFSTTDECVKSLQPGVYVLKDGTRNFKLHIR